MTVKIILVFALIVAAAGYLFSWFRAYRAAPTDTWGQQLAVLQPWWFLDSRLLQGENARIKLQGLVWFIACLIAGGTMYVLSL